MGWIWSRWAWTNDDAVIWERRDGRRPTVASGDIGRKPVDLDGYRYWE